jgi:hydroxymethylbilane synthase
MTHPTPEHTVRIATRSSELALRQAHQVRALLAERGVAAELATYTTVGDRKLDQALSAIGAKGLFTAELEADLLAGRVDCCVHSLKDLPTESPAGLVIAARLAREDPRDALVLAPGVRARSVAELPEGARVGTSSLRRRAQLRARRPDLEVVELRGNVPTRLRKVHEGQVDAAILAAAGLRRLGQDAQMAALLDAPEWLPAAGQGAIAVQVRADDAVMRELAAALDHAPTTLAVTAERELLGALQGGCQVPIGALAVHEHDGWVLHGLVADPEGRRVLRGAARMDPGDPARAGRTLATELRARGADAILAAIRGEAMVPAPQPE